MNKYNSIQINKYRYLRLICSTVLILIGYFIRTEVFIFGLYLYFLNKDIKFNKFIYSSSAVFAFLLITAVRCGLISFVFFPQAEVLLESNESLFFWFKEGHVHAIRLLIAYPGYLISKTFNISLNLGFSYYGILIFLILYNLLIKIVLDKAIIKHYTIIGLMGVIGVLAFLMNGRIAFAFLGYAYLIKAAFIQSSATKFLCFKAAKLYILGALLTSVSSGCMILGLSYIFCCCIIKYLYGIRKYLKIKTAFQAIPMLIIFMPVLKRIGIYVLKMFNKNIDYYGGGLTGLVGLLEHGMGRILPDFGYDSYAILLEIGIVVFLINILLFTFYLVKQKNDYTLLALGINLSLYGILVGLSTGSMGLIPVIIFIMLKFGTYKIGSKI